MIAKPGVSLSFLPQYIVLGMMWIIAKLPRKISNLLVKPLAWLAWKFGGKRVAIARKNIESCFPELAPGEVDLLVKQSFVSVARSMIELCVIWFGSPQMLFSPCNIEGMEHYKAALQSGKGCLLLGFHFTDLEIGGILLADHIERGNLAAMYRDQDNPLTNYYMYRARAKALHPIPRNKIRELFKWIKSGKSIWYAADQDYGPKQSVFVPFFHEKAATITAVSTIVKATGCQVLPFSQSRRNDGGIDLKIHPPLPITGHQPEAEARLINQFLENLIRQRPADYLWTHRRFKTRPGGAREFYGFDKKPKHFLPARKLDRYIEKGNILEGTADRPVLIELKDEQRTQIRLFYASRWRIPSLLPKRVKFWLAKDESYHWAWIRERSCYLVYLRPEKSTDRGERSHEG